MLYGTLRRRYGKPRFYTEAQINRTFEDEGLKQEFYPAALAAFCDSDVRKNAFTRLSASRNFRDFSDVFTDQLALQESGGTSFADTFAYDHGVGGGIHESSGGHGGGDAGGHGGH
jgi:hypothetical protein